MLQTQNKMVTPMTTMYLLSRVFIQCMLTFKTLVAL
jgi:hypothetical protein